MATTIARLQAILSADTTAFDAGLARAEAKMSGTTKVLGAAAIGIGAGVAIMGAKAVSAAADYETGLNTMQAVSGATARQMKEISGLAMKLGNDIKLPGTSAKDAAEAMTELSKSGMRIDQVMKAVRPTLVLSAAAGVSNARAAEITSNALNAFGLDASKTSKIVDILANSANASSLEIEDVADGMKMASAVFAGFMGPSIGAEKSLKQLATAMALMGNAGVKGSDAGTSLKQALMSLVKPTQQQEAIMEVLMLRMKGAKMTEEEYQAVMEGSKKVRDEAMKSIWEQNKGIQISGNLAYTASGKMRSLSDMTGILEEATASMTEEDKASTIARLFGADASRAMLILTKAGKKGFDEMTATLNKNGAAQELANAKMKGLRGAQEALRSSLDTLAITFGLVLLPYVQKFTSALSTGVTFIAEHRTAAMIMTGVLLGLSVAFLAAKVGAALYHSTLISKVIPAVYKWVAAQLAANAALLTNPVFLIVAALIALGAALVIAYKKSETFRKIVDGAFGAVKDIVSGVVDFITEEIPAAFQGILDWLKSNWPEIATIISGPFAPLVALATDSFGIRSKLTGAFTSMASFVEDKVGDIAGFITGLPGRIGNFGSALLTRFTSLFNGAGIGGWITNKIGEFAGFITGIPERIGNFEIALFKKFTGFFTGAGIGGWVSGKVGEFADFITGIPGRIADFGVALFKRFTGFFGGAGIGGWVSARVQDWADFIFGIPGKILDFGPTLLEKVMGFINGAGIGAALVKRIQGWADFFGDLPGKAASAIREKASDLWQAVTDIFEKLPGFVKKILGISSPSKVFADIGHDIVGGIVKGLRSKAGELRDAAMDMAKNIAGDAWDALSGVAGAAGSAVAGAAGAGGGALGFGGGGSREGEQGKPGGGFVSGDIAGLASSFLTQLRNMSGGHGIPIYIQSGFRTWKEQADLVAQKGLWSPSNPTGAAAPGTSLHESGRAADITPGRPSFPFASRYGLNFPIPEEPWHVQSYDRGGWLRPGWNLAWNGLGRLEPVGAAAGGDTYHFHFPQYVGDHRELLNAIRTALKRNQKRN